MKTYYIDLDLPPQQRWTEVINDHKQECLDIFNKIENEFMDSSVITTISKNLALSTIATYRAFNSVMYDEELTSVANILGISVNKLILGQLIYEMFAMCTSTVFKCRDKILHFRTMDWGLPDLKKVTVNLIFVKHRVQIFTATSWAGYVGIMTAMAPGNYTVSLNYRRSNGTLIDNISKALQLKWPIGYLIRYILENEYSFYDAKKIFKEAELISPCYITLGHYTDQTCIIVRDPYNCVSVIENSFVCQTNIDPGCNDSNKDILYSINRRNKINEIITQKVHTWNTFDDILIDMLIHPILNEETVYVTIMNLTDNIHYSEII